MKPTIKPTTSTQRRGFIVALMCLPALLHARKASATPLLPHQAIRQLCTGVFVSPNSRKDGR